MGGCGLPPGVGLGALSSFSIYFPVEVPFGKCKWPCPFKDEIAGLTVVQHFKGGSMNFLFKMCKIQWKYLRRLLQVQTLQEDRFQISNQEIDFTDYTFQ